MPTFRCKIATPGGRVIEKTLSSDTKASLRDLMEREGNFVLEIQRAEGIRGIPGLGTGRGRIKGNELLNFNQEFRVLIKAGLPIPLALEAIIEKGGESELMRILAEIRRDISGGESLSEAFGKYPGIFPPSYVASLRAGERSGNVALAIERQIAYMKKISLIKQKVTKALIYPGILTFVSAFALFFLLIYVVPTFTATYFESGTRLPDMTLALVSFSHFVRSNFLYFVGGAVGVWVGFSFYRKRESGALRTDRLKLAIPFMGQLYLHYSVSKLARTLATLLGGGIPLLDSMEISSGSLDNRYLESRFGEAVQALQEGEGFSKSLARTGSFPSLALRMIDAGESSGALEEVLDDIAEFFEADVDTRLTLLTSAIEPALMIIMGLLIGFIVLAMYLPIFQMAGSVS